MNRRNFLVGMLAACAAPAIVRADSLMRIVPRETRLIIPSLEVAAPADWFSIGDKVTIDDGEFIVTAMSAVRNKIDVQILELLHA